ncbi:20S cyclosome subunit (APC1/BimE) [Rasamsonia emersonii CBS 393.64]|uniref:20S cyclosome subunit (APC1/BimE) n=1 Tax=Rasamsonia emersonii (strain ATCC 16479 / CBS 393.64 / IMI 116815) TaxID=1408163 RepID=A0A0F4Z415_RASE3|nr:20S cyclosome subunit (APC1/BimE) [Rasamsonia emersonii CBS 393.64]KKA24826.1 20S cyclosome subunit (APC1/BimE) [Rasamsonia emersonii CBS 393.64]
MATVRSLGLHQPPALPFLITESLLPPDPSEDDYVWQTLNVEDPSGKSHDEDIIYTKTCVVWSRGGVVKRVFKVDIEKEEIRHVVLTSFPSGKTNKPAGLSSQLATRDCSAGGRQDGQKEKEQHDEIPRLILNADGDGLAGDLNGVSSDLSRALVVVLKTQAHIFFLAGNSHVVPLPFEVDSVFASPRGLVFQRKIHDEGSDALPTAPPNSFVSSQAQADFRSSQSFRSSRGQSSRLSSTVSPAQPSRWAPKHDNNADLPRAFSLTDPHSEMGLVVANQSSRSAYGEPKGFDTLDPADEIVYVSDTNELKGVDRTLADFPLIFVVTLNANTGLYTLWTARYREEESRQDSKRRKMPLASGARSKRRSSHFGMATGATTPAVRPSGMRESFGTARNMSGVSYPQGYQVEENTNETDLASQIGHEFGDIGGVSLKTSRRVSSLLARADLGSSQDRTTFSDLATGNPSNSATYGSLRQSIGGFSNRASFGFNPRSSFPAGNASVYSTNSSFLDAPVDRLLEELNNGGDFEGFESMDLTGSTSGLPKEMMLRKVESFSSGLSPGISFSDLKNSRKPKIFTLRPSGGEDLRKGDSTAIALCLLDRNSKSLVVMNLKIERVTLSAEDLAYARKQRKGHKTSQQSLVVHATDIRRGSNILDACKIVDGDVSRILALSSTMDGRGELTLQSPWSTPVKIDLPSNLLLHEPHRMSIPRLSNRPQDTGLKRVIGDSSLKLIGVDHPSSHGKVDVIDSQKRRHRIQIQLQPSNPLVKKMLAVCRFVLKDSAGAGDGLIVGWWEVLRWLRSREVNENDLEWTAMVVVLFTMAVGFIESSQPQPATPVKQTRRKKSLLRSSSGSYVDLESWNSMLEQMAGSSGISSPWMMSSSWAWVSEQDGDDFAGSPRHGKSPKIEQRPFAASSAASRDYPKNSYLIRCASLAREFFESPQGEAASGSEGYLPTAVSQNQNTRRTALCTILIGLHLLREEQKLSVCDSESSYREMGLLAPVLAQIGGWLGWPSWTWKDAGYYLTEMASMDRWLFEDTRISGLEVPAEPFAPPSIFAFLKDSWNQPSSSFFTLLDIVSAADREPEKGKLWHEAFSLTPRTLALTGFMSEVSQKSTTVDRTKLLLRWGLTSNVIETFPEGVSAPLYEIIVRCQINPPASWTAELVELIDRDDLYLSMNTENSMAPVSRSQPASSHDAIRDFHHIGASTLDVDLTNSFEASIEADRIAITKLIFREDRRFVEASKLLNQSKAPVAQCIPEPEWSDSDLLEAQKEVVQLVTLRTLSVPAGRGMFMFSGRSPLLTEKLPIPSFSLQCVMKPSNVTISADRSLFSEEKVCWAFFHNGAATGLAISRASKGIDTSWILFNKPQELTNRHAGFLLALGLNGHLKNLAKWVAFKYLTPKHTMTSIGLLLGLSASYLGTMDTLITRLLSVHVTRMLPQGAAELNLSPLTQTAGIMGIGLLYCNSQHRRMSEVLLSEIENVEQEDSTISQEDLRDEGYRLAAGFALGFINLGKGKDLRGLRDMQVVERLLALAVGTKNVDLVHILDRATAGATVALAIIFMKTNDEALARKIDIPDTTVQFDYVRPDIFLLRTLARHLIMWDSICPTYEWFAQSIPPVYRRRYRLTGIRRLRSDDMPFFNIIAGLCFAIGLRYAGSALPQARDLLLSYLDQFIRICRLPALHYDAKLARNSVRNCQDIVALSAAAVMAGTGDLALFRRLRSLHGRVDPDTPYGSHMAAHMAIGLLFLGGGSYTLGTSNLAIASLLCAFYPIFPTTVLDNKCHLQAFRHLWVFAAEPRCLVPRDVDTRRPISIPVSLTMKNGETKEVTAPCLLPDLDEIAMIKAHGRDHWPLVLDFSRNEQLREKFRRGDQSIYLRRNTTYDPSGSSVFASTLLGLSEAQDILPSSAMKGPTAQLPNTVALLLSQGRRSQVPTHDLWDWIFSLPSLQWLDVADRSIVLPPSPFQFRPRYPSDGGIVSLPPWLRLSSIDTRLVLESTVNGAVAAASGDSNSNGNGSDEVRDRLWQLRLLFDWVDRGFDGDDKPEQSEGEKEKENDGQTAEKQKGLWLRRDVIEEARWKIWGVQRGKERR